MTTETHKRGVIYARYSCDKQREESIIGQVRDCRAAADREGVEIIDIYKDEGISGQTDQRPSFQRMIRDAAYGRFEYVFVWKGDRFARNRLHAIYYKQVLAKAGVKLFYAMEPNVDGPTGDMVSGLNELIAENYSRDLSVKVSRGMRENVIAGKWNGRVTPYGYDVVDSKLVVNPSEAAIVRELFYTYTTSEKSICAIQKIFKKKGYLGKNGKPMSHYSLERMLKRKLYLGIYSFNDTVNSECFEAIIDQDTFQKAQYKMLEHQKCRSKFKSKEGFLLSGKIFCGECGAKMNGAAGTARNGSVHRYYSCRANKPKGYPSRSYPKAMIESLVVAQLLDLIGSKRFREKMASYVFDFVDNQDPTLENAKKALEATQSKIKNLITVIEQGTFVLDDINSRLKELNEIRENQKKEIYRLEKEGDILTRDQVLYFLEHTDQFDPTTYDGVQSLVDLLVKKVVVYPNNRCEIYLKFRDDFGPFSKNAHGSSSEASGPPY